MSAEQDYLHAGWIGRETQDPYGEPLGTVLEVLSDLSTGTQEWLLLAGGEQRGRLAPLRDAIVTGQKVRVAATAGQVRSAPSLAAGEPLSVDAKLAAAEHYGLSLDMRRSPSGLLSADDDSRAADGGPEQRSSPAPASDRREEIVKRLAAAHAMEQASLKLLAAMRWRTDDQELVHDLALHHKATNDHAKAVRERLDALGSPRARPLDWLGKLVAYVRAQPGRLRSPPEPGDLRAAHAFEQREIEAYSEIERLAGEAGDARTAKMCRAIRADEEFMALTLSKSRLWRDPGLRRGRRSPFEAAPGRQQAPPRS